jgi:hypothetical protein
MLDWRLAGGDNRRTANALLGYFQRFLAIFPPRRPAAAAAVVAVVAVVFLLHPQQLH